MMEQQAEKLQLKLLPKIIKRIAPILGIEKQNNIKNLIVKKERINFASY